MNKAQFIIEGQHEDGSDAREHWHLWFAWRPVFAINYDDKKQLVWFRRIGRKGVLLFSNSDIGEVWKWEYSI